MKPDKPKTPIKLAVFLIGGYVLTIIILFCFKVIEIESLWLISTSALGWLIALVIAIIHLNKAKEDNQEATKYEIKKKLEIEAYRDVNKAINNFSNTITSVSTLFFYTVPSKLELHIQNPMIFKFDRIQIDQDWLLDTPKKKMVLKKGEIDMEALEAEMDEIKREAEADLQRKDSSKGVVITRGWGDDD